MRMKNKLGLGGAEGAMALGPQTITDIKQ